VKTAYSPRISNERTCFVFHIIRRPKTSRIGETLLNTILLFKRLFLTNYKESTTRDWLRAGRSGDRIPLGSRFFSRVQTGPGAHSASSKMGTGYFPGVKVAGRNADPLPPSSAVVKKE